MRLTCAFGRRWPCRPCRRCRREADRLEREFWRSVFFGDWDRQGYRPSDRRGGRR